MLNSLFSPAHGSFAKTRPLLFIALLPVIIGIAPAQSIQAEPVASDSTARSAASTTPWQGLPYSGLDLRVRGMEVVGTDLYVGGDFTRTGDGVSMTDLGRMVRYDTVTQTWNPPTNQGLSSEVLALAVIGDDLYVGGWFTQTVDGAVTNLGNIARYNITSATWHTLTNEGLNDHVFDMAVIGNDLYVGGIFEQSGDGTVSDLNGIARYDTANPGWHALPNQGLNGNVYVLETNGNNLYAGGGFNNTGDTSQSDLNYIARYDAANPGWHALSNQGLDGQVNGLIVSASDLYVGGWFAATNDGAVTNLNRIARYGITGETWYGLSNQGLDDAVSVFAVVDNILYVGGHFNQTSDGAVTNLGYFARYDISSSSWYTTPNQGLNNWVYDLVHSGCSLYVGGEFNSSGDGTVSGISHIARYNLCLNELYLPLIIKQ